MTPPLWQKVKKNEPLDESERGELKSWLKAQHSENEDHGTQLHLHGRLTGKQWKQGKTLFSGL